MIFRMGYRIGCGLVGIAIVPVIQQSAQAIVINDTAGAATARRLGAPFTAVAEVTIDGALDCSGSLISRSHVLTAQHCTFGRDLSRLGVQFYDSDATNALIDTVAVKTVFNIDETNNLFDGTDISILELSSPAQASISPLRLLGDDTNLTGTRSTFVGFGFQGVGSLDNSFTSGSIRWAAENVIDREVLLPEGNKILSTDFDNGTNESNTLADFGSSPVPLANEGTTAPGDSGAPLLVDFAGELVIAGILSGGTDPNSAYGDLSFWTASRQSRSLIEARGGQFVEAANSVSTPEPSALIAIASLGAAITGWTRRSAG